MFGILLISGLLSASYFGDQAVCPKRVKDNHNPWQNLQ